VHQPGSRLSSVEDMSKEQLEEAIESFCLSPDCPLLVQEEFEESQKDLDTEVEDCNDADANAVDNLPGEGDDELLVQPEPQQELYEQKEWMDALRPIANDDQLMDGGGDYDDAKLVVEADNTDWNKDARAMKMTAEKFKELDSWVQVQKTTHPIGRDDDAMGGMPMDLNDKQFIAFAIMRDFILKAKTLEIHKIPQLLLNMSGSPGTGKSFWLNTVKRFSRQHFGPAFVTTDAP
jgi:hypothetical protein